jgi:hypothetical protein
MNPVSAKRKPSSESRNISKANEIENGRRYGRGAKRAASLKRECGNIQQSLWTGKTSCNARRERHNQM